ncbi:MAG: hypothetical protein QOH33_1262 [Paraburkholderia sp.]|nr:hypothetical protein [Paraburkholderia sp.]
MRAAAIRATHAGTASLVKWTPLPHSTKDIMRGTRAISAVERLKARSGNAGYTAVGMPGGWFRLVDKTGGIEREVGEPMPLEAFVAFIDKLGPPKPKKTSKFDEAFEAQIKRSGR